MPPAPGPFSTTTPRPQWPANSSPSVRATMSTAPPGANGTKRCTGRDGKASCAGAVPVAASSDTVAASSLIDWFIAWLLQIAFKPYFAFGQSLNALVDPRGADLSATGG